MSESAEQSTKSKKQKASHTCEANKSDKPIADDKKEVPNKGCAYIVIYEEPNESEEYPGFIERSTIRAYKTKEECIHDVCDVINKRLEVINIKRVPETHYGMIDCEWMKGQWINCAQMSKERLLYAVDKQHANLRISERARNKAVKNESSLDEFWTDLFTTHTRAQIMVYSIMQIAPKVYDMQSLVTGKLSYALPYAPTKDPTSTAYDTDTEDDSSDSDDSD